MSKKRPKTGSKMEPAYWLGRLFNSTYTYRGRRFKARAWSVKIQHLGRRKTFSLPSGQRRQAAAEACQLYRTIVNNGWETARARNGRSTAPASPLAAEAISWCPDRFHQDFWAQRLIHREYTMSLDAGAESEISVQVDH